MTKDTVAIKYKVHKDGTVEVVKRFNLFDPKMKKFIKW